MDICTNHQVFKSLHNGLHTIVEQLNLNFSKAWDEISLIQQHILKQDGVTKGFHKELVDKLGSFVDDYLLCKGISTDWHTLVNNHCLATEKILESLGANCLKLFDHYDVVATRCNQKEEQINAIKADVSRLTHIVKNTQPAIGSSPTFETLEKRLKQLELSISEKDAKIIQLQTDISLILLSYSKLWEDKSNSESRLVDIIIDLTSCMVKLEACSYSQLSVYSKSSLRIFFLETNSKASLEPSKSTPSTAPMVAPVLHVKLEQLYDKYKLYANHLPKSNCKSNLYNFLIF